MKRTKMIPLVLVFVSILGFYGIALSGGDPGSCTSPPPSPTSGPFITGTFTAALNQFDYDSYDVHLELAHRFKVHLFSWSYDLLGGGPSLCDLTPEMIKDPTGFLALVPCLIDVGTPFGLNGTPVIKDVFILKRDFCDLPGDPRQMIFGTITIRVVP
jgi:hypothetical protein